MPVSTDGPRSRTPRCGVGFRDFGQTRRPACTANASARPHAPRRREAGAAERQGCPSRCGSAPTVRSTCPTASGCSGRERPAPRSRRAEAGGRPCKRTGARERGGWSSTWNEGGARPGTRGLRPGGAPPSSRAQPSSARGCSKGRTARATSPFTLAHLARIAIVAVGGPAGGAIYGTGAKRAAALSGDRLANNRRPTGRSATSRAPVRWRLAEAMEATAPARAS
jgi:hypothetical protein